jgi:hypothetical protein
MLNWFSAAESERFGKELAEFVYTDIASSTVRDEAKFAARTEKTLLRAEQKLTEFKARERLNVFKKAKLANAFLWTLRDRGCPTEHADKLTEWLSTRM